jgi:hypothetical protein
MKFNYDDRKKINFLDIENNVQDESDKVVAIIIPFRNRINHLQDFIKHFNLLYSNNIIHIYIIDQNNSDKFNRGLLLNIGFLIAKKKFNYHRYIFHDIDSLPDQTIYKQYFNQTDKIIHYASPYLGYKYTYSKFFGGIVGFTSSDFEKINGFPNTFFGWGGEDSSLYNRVAFHDLPVYRPTKGKFILLDHPQASKTESTNDKFNHLVRDLKEWKLDGLKQLRNFFINIKEYDNIDIFLSKYDLDSDIITDTTLTLDKYLSSDEINDSSLQSGSIKYYYYKIDYLSLHGKTFDKLLDKNFIKNKIDTKIKELKGQKYFQHKKNPIYISYIEPLIYWEDIENKIIETYTEPKKFNLEIVMNKKQKRVQKLLIKYFSKYENKLTKTDLFNTIKHIFDNYNELLYFRIRDNKLYSYHIYNPKNKTDWYKYLQYKTDNGIKNIDDSLLEIIEKSGKTFYTLRKPHFIAANNCLLGFDAYSYFEGNPMGYVLEFKKMLLFTIKKFKNVPDSDILINRKDFPYLSNDKHLSYNHLWSTIPKEYKYDIPKFWPIGSQSRKSCHLDIPIPSADEWKDIKLFKSYKHIEWKDKKAIGFFRGSSTGCGSTIENNPRLKLADIGNKNKDKLDIGLTVLTTRIKVYNSFIGIIDNNKYKYMLGSFVSPQEQLKYKYIFNIEGNAQAYRYGNEFKKKSLILSVKSEYKMWFEPLLKHNKHMIEIEQDYRNLKEILKYLNENDDKAEKIMLCGYKFSKNYINKKMISFYWFLYMYYSNSYKS